MAVAYIGVGSNLGDCMSNCRQAIESLNTERTQVTRVSSFYQTAPVGYLEQPDFINAVARVQTRLAPAELLELLQQIERGLGKCITVRWGPRTIDLDIILYDNLVMRHECLQIPHPRMTERAFVLVPLAEIAPQLKCPQTGKTMAELVESVDKGCVCKVK